MLLKFRGGLDSLLVKVLLGALIAAFAVWGIGPSMLNVGSQNVATVGDTDVSAQRYYSAVQNRAQTLQQQFGAQFSIDQIISMMRLEDQILQQLIAQASVTQHLKDLGMRATDGQVAKDLLDIEAFTLPDGRFSEEMMNTSLRSAGITEKELFDDIRDNISRTYLLESLTTNKMASESAAKVLYSYQAERRRATMINIQASDVSGVSAPTDEEIQAYYDENKSAYMTPERRSYRYMLITPEQFMDKVSIDEAQLLNAYNATIGEYVKPEKRALQQVFFTDKAIADTFLQLVNAGTDFAEAASTVTNFSSDEINLGDFSKEEAANTYDSNTADLLFSLAENNTTDVIEANDGFNIFKVTSITPATSRSFEEVKPEIEAIYKQDEAIGLMIDSYNTIDNELADDPDLARIANENNLSLATVSGVDSRGTKEDGTAAVTSQVEYTVLLDMNNRELDDDDLEIIDLDERDPDKGLFVGELTDVVEPQQRPLEDVKSEIAKSLFDTRKLEKAGELAELAKAKLEAGENSEEIAAELNGTSFDAKNVSRTSTESSSLSANIRALIFDLKKDEIAFERATDNNGYVIVRIDEINAADPDAKPLEVQKLLTEMNEQSVNEIFGQYEAFLRNKYQPTVNNQIKQKLFNQNTQ